MQAHWTRWYRQRRWKRLRAQQLQYLGVWREGSIYNKGSFVTHQGSLWHANEADMARPGGDSAWTLAVKRGRVAK